MYMSSQSLISLMHEIHLSAYLVFAKDVNACEVESNLSTYGK